MPRNPLILLLIVAGSLMLFPRSTSAEDRYAGFTRALPGYEFEFPRDHGSHPDFRTEWWYFTGNVSTPEGREFGFKYTIFRNALASPNAEATQRSPLVADQIYLAHFAISDITGKTHESWERIARAGFGQGEASTERLDARVGEWTMHMEDDETIHLNTRVDHAGMSISLKPLKPFVIHGEGGAHQKAGIEGQASHYISYTRLAATGTIIWQDEEYTVEGIGWKDHEFGTNWLTEDQVGWDWFALQLDTGDDLMIYGIRMKDGSFADSSSGSRIDKEGKLEKLPIGDYQIEATGSWTSTASRATYPMGWRIRIDSLDADLDVEVPFPEQEMLTTRYTNTVYWEGAIRVSGTMGGRPVTGKGYVELVGYASAFSLL